MGEVQVRPRGEQFRGRAVSFDLVRIAAGDRIELTAPPGDEAVAVLLAGDVTWLDQRSTRATVFDGPATAAYLPPGTTTTAVAHADTEVGLLATTGGDLVAPADAQPVLIRPEQVVVHDRGQGHWHREVHDVLADTVVDPSTGVTIPAARLIVGETFNDPGGWSSFPPHKHDGTDGEPALEEVYHYRFDRPDGFGFQGLYAKDGSADARLVRHGDTVGIDRGYHPVCAAPGYRLYYLWGLAGEVRRLTMVEDPAHVWLHGAT